MHFLRTKKRWGPILVALVGLCVGTGLDEALRLARNRNLKTRHQDISEAFQRRVRCREFANDFVKKSSDDNTALFLERIDFSPARDSCIAAVSRAISGKRGTLWSYETIDILTDETLLSGGCNDDANSRIFAAMEGMSN